MARPRQLTLYTFDEVMKLNNDGITMAAFDFWLPPEDLWFVLKNDLTGKATDIYNFDINESLPNGLISDITKAEIFNAFKDHDFKTISNGQQYKAACKEAAERYMLKHMFEVIDDPFTIRIMKTIMGTYNMMALYFDSTVMGHQEFTNKIHAKIQDLPSYVEFKPDEPVEKQPNEQGYDEYIVELNEFIFTTIPNMNEPEIDGVLNSNESLQDAYIILDEMEDYKLSYFYLYLTLHKPDVLPVTASNMREKFGDNEEVALFIRKMRYVLKED